MIFIDYLPAELKANKSRWYVSYHVKNPQTGKLHRKTIKVNRVKNLTERKRYAQKLVVEINEKLKTGWNPYIEQEAPRAFIKLIESLNIYLNTKTRELKNEDTIRTYKSIVNILQNYVINIKKTPDLLVINFDVYFARNYADYLYNERKLSGITFNNYILKTSIIWNWFIENLYCKINPFSIIKKKKEYAKTRKIIDTETRIKLKNYLIENNDYEFLAIVLLCFHGFIRPKEICHMKPGFINMEKKIIFLPKEFTKDDDDRVITITDELYQCLEKLNIQEISKDLYIFSEKWKPGTKLINTRYIGKYWDKLRKILNMPMEYQFYSLKDSGIVQKFRDGINPLEIRDQAGHSTLEQTNVYAKYANQKGGEDIKTKSSEF